MWSRDADAFQRALETPGDPVGPRVPVRLLDTVGALATLAPATPARPDFVTDLRAALLLEAAALARPTAPDPAAPLPDSLAPAPLRTPRRHRGLAVAAGVATVVAASTSVSYAAQAALPGQALYPVKRVLENAQISLASGSGRTGGLIDHAGRRLQEASDLTARGDAVGRSQVADTVSTFTAQAAEAGHRALDSGDPAQVAELRRFAAASMDQLVSLRGVAPASAHGALLRAATEVVALDALAVSQCGDCGVDDLPLLTLPVTFTHAWGHLELFPGFTAHGSLPVRGISVPGLLGGGGWTPPGVTGGAAGGGSSYDTSTTSTTDTTVSGAGTGTAETSSDPTSTPSTPSTSAPASGTTTDSATTDTGSTDTGGTDTTGSTGGAADATDDGTDTGTTDSGDTGTTDAGTTDPDPGTDTGGDTGTDAGTGSTGDSSGTDTDTDSGTDTDTDTDTTVADGSSGRVVATDGDTTSTDSDATGDSGTTAAASDTGETATQS